MKTFCLISDINILLRFFVVLHLGKSYFHQYIYPDNIYFTHFFKVQFRGLVHIQIHAAVGKIWHYRLDRVKINLDVTFTCPVTHTKNLKCSEQYRQCCRLLNNCEIYYGHSTWLPFMQLLKKVKSYSKGRVPKKANHSLLVDKRFTPPLIHFGKINNIHIKKFFIHIRWPPPLPLSTFIEINNIF